MLRTALGPVIGTALADSTVIEVMANPDGSLWIERLGEDRVREPERLGAAEAERIIRLVASHVGAECHRDSPIVSAELPETGERFEGLLPPLSSAPCFAIRKPAQSLFRLSDYVEARILGGAHADALRLAVRDRRNILIAGGTSSGKTTLANAILAEIAEAGDRVVILEDTRELACTAEDFVQLRTKPGVASLRDLIRSTMRLRPDRIIIGEVRGAEAIDLLKAWNTGHPGGIATVHANSAEAALSRLEQLCEEVVPTAPRTLIAEAIDIVIFIARRAEGRRVETILRVDGLSADGGYRLSPLAAPDLALVQPGE
jgi:type IV secretion system protein VirB11